MERISRMGKSKNLIFTIGVAVIVIIYLILRLSFPETIEFGYDQPRLATRVIEFINNEKIFETQKFAEKAPWGNISWGPSLFYFYAPFLLISKNPLALSYLLAIFNVISILGIIYLSSKYLSKKTGLFAGLILAIQPWWVIFSRMIYQPTPVITLIVISMIFYFFTLKKPNSIYYSLLIFSWTFLVEIYFHTISFVLISFMLIIIHNYKKMLNKYLIVGIIISNFLIIPFVLIDSKSDYFPVKKENISDTFQVGRDDPWSRVKSIVPGYIKTFSGGSMEYQLGYSHSEFYNQYRYFHTLETIVSILTIVVLIYNLVMLIISKKLRFERLSFLLWSLSPLLFLIFMPLPNVPPIPRYFLFSFPALAILYGLFFSEVYKYTKLILIILTVPIFWIYFTYSYSKFIINYNFPKGHLSVYSDSQYLFLFNAIKSARSNNIKNGRSNFILSNDDSVPKELSMDYATKYVWTNVFNYKMINTSINNGYYLINYSIQKDDIRFRQLGRFGPYSLYEFNDL